MLTQAHIGFLAWAHFSFVPWATVLETPIYGRQGDYTEGEIKTLILYDFCLCIHLLGHPGKQHPWVWLPPPCPLQSRPGQFPNYLKAEESAVWVWIFSSFLEPEPECSSPTELSELSSQVLCSFGSDVSLSAPEFLEGCADLCSKCLLTHFFIDIVSWARSRPFFFTELPKEGSSFQASQPWTPGCM